MPGDCPGIFRTNAGTKFAWHMHIDREARRCSIMRAAAPLWHISYAANLAQRPCATMSPSPFVMHREMPPRYNDCLSS